MFRDVNAIFFYLKRQKIRSFLKSFLLILLKAFQKKNELNQEELAVTGILIKKILSTPSAERKSFGERFCILNKEFCTQKRRI